MEVADTSINGSKKDIGRKSHLEAEVKRLDELVKVKEKELGSFALVSTGLAELRMNADKLYQSFVGVKQFMEGLKGLEEGFLEEKPTINTSKGLNSNVPSSTNNISSNFEQNISKKMDEIKTKFNKLQTISQEILHLAKSKGLCPNKQSKQSIAIS